jgi:hypothetical protein
LFPPHQFFKGVFVSYMYLKIIKLTRPSVFYSFLKHFNVDLFM